jgi:hypothetical protein
MPDYVTLPTWRPQSLRLGRDPFDESHGTFTDQSCHSPLNPMFLQGD